MAMLKRGVQDESNWEVQNVFHMSHLTQNLNLGFIDALFPASYASERIFLMYPEAVTPLFEIVEDARQSERIRNVAWRILVDSNDPRFLPTLRRCEVSGA